MEHSNKKTVLDPYHQGGVGLEYLWRAGRWVLLNDAIFGLSTT